MVHNKTQKVAKGSPADVRSKHRILRVARKHVSCEPASDEDIQVETAGAGGACKKKNKSRSLTVGAKQFCHTFFVWIKRQGDTKVPGRGIPCMPQNEENEGDPTSPWERHRIPEVQSISQTPIHWTSPLLLGEGRNGAASDIAKC